MDSRYETDYRRSLETPETFWSEAAGSLRWHKPWERIVDGDDPSAPTWFAGGELNTCENALDVHVEEGRGEQLALIYDSAVTETCERYTYRELLASVAELAGALAGLGVERGDRVIIYMPMVPQTVHAMLACARLGAIHSVVFGGFASGELAARIDDATPKLLLTASCGIEGERIVAYKPLVDEALARSHHAPEHVVVLQRPQCDASMTPGRDLTWPELLDGAMPAPPVRVGATDPLYILYTSGTTGQPKGIVRDHGGHAVALKWSMENVYGVAPSDVFWAASDVGWVVGHSYIVYAPLLHGCTTVLYEGKPVGTPDPGAFWRVVEDHGVNVLFTAPTAFRAIKREDPNGDYRRRYRTSSLRSLFLAGERCDPATLQWATDTLGVPVIDHWWQTESGWPMVSNCLGLGAFDIRPGSPTKPVPGFDVRVVDDTGAEVEDGVMGHIAVKLPLPPGCVQTLWNDPEAFRTKYLTAFPGYYQSSDSGYRDADGYFWIMTRTDDVINVSGHRLSTGAIEEVLAAHPDVAECAVVGVADALRGQVPLGLVVLSAGVDRDADAIEMELRSLVRKQIGPVAAFKQVAFVGRLPKTRSGKVLRATIRKMADGESFTTPPTIDDPEILTEIGAALRELGYPSSS